MSERHEEASQVEHHPPHADQISVPTALPPPQPHTMNLDALIWALALIWTGLVLLVADLNYLTWFTLRTFELPWDLPFGSEVWTLVFLGLGVLMVISIIVRLAVPAHRHNIIGYIILSVVFFCLALGYAELIWPITLVVIGVALLTRHRQW